MKEWLTSDQPGQSDSTPINWEERAEGEPEGGGRPEQAVSEDQGEVPIDVDEPFEAVNNFGVYRTADEQEDDSPSESGGDVQVGEGQEGGHGCPVFSVCTTGTMQLNAKPMGWPRP